MNALGKQAWAWLEGAEIRISCNLGCIITVKQAQELKEDLEVAIKMSQQPKEDLDIRLRKVIDRLRPKREDWIDDESFERACDDWRNALESEGIDHP